MAKPVPDPVPVYLCTFCGFACTAPADGKSATHHEYPGGCLIAVAKTLADIVVRVTALEKK